MGEMIDFLRADGKPARGYLAQAQDPQAPGVVVIQEWWGLQDQIKAVCDEFAKSGYHALAPDLFHGHVVPYHDAEQANREMNSLNFLEATDQEVRGAVLHLAKQGRRVGLTGFCMGGAITVIGAVRIPELRAAVCFYGLPPESVAAPQDIQVPIQCHFANHDDWCKPELVDRFEAQLKQAGKPHEIYRYDAQHGFVNWQRQDVYDEQARQLAWSRCLDFWQRYLQ